jgi:hypothetical protein
VAQATQLLAFVGGEALALSSVDVDAAELR